MNAKEAREKAAAYSKSEDQECLREARRVIGKAAECGLLQAHTYMRLSMGAKAVLEADGFALYEWDEQKDGYGCRITW